MRTKLTLVFAFLAIQFSVANTFVTVDPVAPSLSPLLYCDSNNDGVGVFNLNEQNSAILAAQSGNASDYAISYHETITDANVGINPMSSPFVNISAWNQVVYYRITTINTGTFAVGSFQLIVNSSPEAIVPNDYHLCDFSGPAGYEVFDLTTVIPEVLGTIDSATVSVHFYTDAGLTNQIANPPVYTNSTAWIQTVYVEVVVLATGCYDVVPLNLVVDPLPQLIAPSGPYEFCDNDQDGITVVNLTPLIPGLLNGGTYSVTFHETLIDAELSGTTIPSPSSYATINPYYQTIYARGTDPVTGCYSIVSVGLLINPAPMISSLPSVVVCDQDSNPQSGSTIVNLTVQTPAILAVQPLMASQYTVTYYTSQSNAQSGVTPIMNPSTYFGANGVGIWYRIVQNATGCYNIGSFHLVINTPLTLTTPTPLAVCDNDALPNNQYTTFDLTVKSNEILSSMPGYTITYYPSYPVMPSSVAIANPNAYINAQPAVQTLGVKVTSPQGCVSYTTLDIRVYPIPTPQTNPSPIAVCDSDGDGFVNVDLTVNSDYIVNGNPFLTLRYFATQSDAMDNINQIMNPFAAAVAGNVWIRVENFAVDYNGNQCYVLVEQSIIINSLPMVLQPNYPQYFLYDYGNDGTETFDLTTQISNIVMGQSGCTVFFYPSFADAVNGTNVIYNASAFTNTSIYVQTLGIRVVNAAGCYAISTMDVVTSPEVPAPAGPFSQNFSEGDTLADLIVSGVDVQWYATANNKMSAMTSVQQALPLNTLLVDGTTYYATQTINGVESTSRLPVTVHVVLGVKDTELLPVQYAPNPVKNSLTLQSGKLLKSVTVYTILGQKMLEQPCNDTHVMVDMSHLASGNYILKVQGETGQKTLRVIKE